MNYDDSIIKDGRITHIKDAIIELASRNFDITLTPSDKNDEIDVIITGINMRCEELKKYTVSKDYMQSVIKGIADMLIVLDNNYNIKDVNDSACSVLKYSREELINMPFFLLEKKKESEQLDRYLNSQGVSYNLEKKFFTKLGQEVPVSCSMSILWNSLNIREGYVFIAKDISQLTQTQKKLQEKNDDLNSFFYRISHDMKGPLASIDGIVNVAKMEQKDKSSLVHFDFIQQSTTRLNNILVNLVENVKLNNTEVRPEVIDFEKVIANTIHSMAHLPGMDKINVEKSIEYYEGFISDENILFSIIQNLIDNSIKYKDEGKAQRIIKIGVRFLNNEAIISVKDNGIGISANHLPKVFDMFYRATYSSKGSGLGLFIVKGCVKKLGGTIEVNSVEKEWTEVTIKLPSL